MRRLAAIALAAFSLVPLAASADITPGQWELTVTASVAGMGALEPVTRMQCLTAADVRDPARVFGPNNNPGCTFANQRDTGAEFTFNVSCTGKVPVTGSGRVRYAGNSLNAEMDLSGEASGQKFSTQSKVSGRRMGPC